MTSHGFGGSASSTLAGVSATAVGGSVFSEASATTASSFFSSSTTISFSVLVVASSVFVSGAGAGASTAFSSTGIKVETFSKTKKIGPET
jgi:hypothetical protein